MTRGQIAIIQSQSHISTSIEFNGDMYMPDGEWAGHGQEVIDLLKEVKDWADYAYAVAKFNKENHHYIERDGLTRECDGDAASDMLDFTHDYFGNWFSDYVYIKNVSGKDVAIRCEDKDENPQDVTLKDGQIAVLCFGRLELIA